MKNLAIAGVLAAALYGQSYELGPDSQPQAGVPKGVVTRHTLAPGRFYPGTPHNYALYVPAQYEPNRPAPFMIFLDGSGALGNNVRAPIVLDNLIAKKEIPPLIGIFIDPGVLPALNDQSQNRFERIFEYDSISGRFAQFLTEELIPEIGTQYNLSKDPNDHAIEGVSTGAVGAFIAAWERPDQFRRVLSFIGTFVAMKGADTLPATIRKTEPKPIRVFLQAGRNDHIAEGHPYGTFYAGSWPVNNQVMAQALEYAGYDVKLEMGEEAHNMRHGAAILPDALRWLWRDYPKPIVVREPAGMTRQGWDPRGAVFAIISADKPWEQVGERYGSAASPTADKAGNVYFSDAASNRIYRADAAGKVSIFKENTGGAAALRFGPDGRLYAAQLTKKRIVSYGQSGDEKLLAENVEANDLAMTVDGGLYYVETSKRRIGYIVPKGKRVPLEESSEIAAPAAISLSPDQGLAIVGDAQTRFSWSFQIASDGRFMHGEPFFRVDIPEMATRSEVAGVTVDATGQVYFADALGIQVCEQNGRCMQILAKPENGALTGIAFGGPDLNWLYVTENGKLFRRQVKVKGVSAWAPVKPPRPPL